MSIPKASRKHSIPYGTIFNHCHGLHKLKTGGQPRLSAEAEHKLAEPIETLAQGKVPVDFMDVRLLVKDYLDRQGISHRRFVTTSLVQTG